MTPLTIVADCERSTAMHRDGGLPLHASQHDGTTATVAAIGLLRHGTANGNAVVMMRIELPDGQYVVAQTTWKLMSLAVKALAGTPIASEEVLDP
jgi:hypothetical protein